MLALAVVAAVARPRARVLAEQRGGLGARRERVGARRERRERRGGGDWAW